MSRGRAREGRHVSVGGAAAEEVLESLVKQFADPYAFIRELLQNSLDAGAARIDTRIVYADDELRVDVQDDGDGMDRAIIEGYLLTLFRSTKEDDLTKIGKFGIGFTSIFAMNPFEVVVDTGRDGVWHRVRFDAQRQYTLSRLPEPYEGTTVTLRIRADRAAASASAERIRDAIFRWCRYADAAITVSATGTTPAWESVRIAAPFTVGAPVSVTVERDGFRAVLGPHPGPRPPVGFFNRGITLWEAEDPLVPGVCFRVAARHLEHTLTRDNVIRDRHFEAVIEGLHAAAQDALGPAVHAALAEAAHSGEPDRSAELCARFAPQVAWSWDEAGLWMPGIGSEGQVIPLALSAFAPRRSLVARFRGTSPPLYWAEPGCAVGAALTRGGHAVLAGAAGGAHIQWVAGYWKSTPIRAADAWCAPKRLEAGALHALLVATGALLGVPLSAGVLTGRGRALDGRLVVALAETQELLPTPLPTARGAPLLLQHDHPLVVALVGQPVALGAPVLATALRAALGMGPLPELGQALGRAVAARP